MARDRRGSGTGGDRFAVFPFSIGCMSQSSVAIADPNPNEKTKPQSEPSSSTTTTTAAQGSEEGGGETTMKQAATVAVSPGIVVAGVQRLMKGIKSLSQMFAVDDEDEEDEEEREIVIGYPTDVQHVGHIGWDGHGGLSKVGAGAMGMVNAFSLPSSLSLRQLEMAMDHQAAHS